MDNVECSKMIGARIPKTTDDWLRQRAEREGLTVGEYLRDLIVKAQAQDTELEKAITKPQEKTNLGNHPCPLCGTVVDWDVVKNHTHFIAITQPKSWKQCPNCGRRIYEKRGRKWIMIIKAGK